MSARVFVCVGREWRDAVEVYDIRHSRCVCTDIFKHRFHDETKQRSDTEDEKTGIPFRI